MPGFFVCGIKNIYTRPSGGFFIGTTMRALELITDAGTGQLSGTKIWIHIGYIAATIAFLKIAFSSGVTQEILMTYMGVIGTHGVGSKIVSMKYGDKPDASNSTDT